MQKKNNMWIVSELFYPDETSTGYILTTIAEALTEQENVQVICGPASYQQSNLTAAYPLSEKIHLTRVSLPDLDKNKVLSRIIRLVLLSLKLSWQLGTKARKGDKVLMVTNPAPLVVLLPAICKWKKLKLFVLVHDVFPENLPVAGFIKATNPLYKLLRSLFNRAYAKAKCLIVLGRDMEQLMTQKLAAFSTIPKIKIIENWADVENIYPLGQTEETTLLTTSQKKIVFQFAGNLGRVQGLMPLLDCIRLSDNAYLQFTFIGSGALKEEMMQYVQQHGMSNVNILPSFSRGEQNANLNACDIGIVCLAKGMTGLGVPSKTYNILSAGKPVLYIGAAASEISQLVAEEKIGWAFDTFGKELISFLESFDQEKLSESIAMGKKARSVALTRFTKAYILNEYKLLVKLI